jgi:hypothetical protein
MQANNRSVLRKNNYYVVVVMTEKSPARCLGLAETSLTAALLHFCGDKACMGTVPSLCDDNKFLDRAL